MKQNKKNAEGANNSNALAPVEVEDNTTTVGKVSTHYTTEDQAAAEVAAGKLDKNAVFAQVAEALCPVHFDATPLESSLKPLVDSGIMSEDVMQATISKARAEYLAAHAKEMEAAESMSFAEVVAKIEAAPGLLAKVLKVCNVDSLVESDYIQNGQCLIYRAAQSLDKDGSPRYDDGTLSKAVDGRTFTVPLYVERRPVSTSNMVLAIRYHQSLLDARRRLEFAISKHRAVLRDVEAAAAKAKEAGFTRTQVEAALAKVFA